MKRLGRDRSAEENLLKPIVFLFTFVGVAGLLLWSMSDVQQVAQGELSDESRYTLTLGEYTAWNPADGWNVTWANATDLDPEDLSSVDFEFTNEAETDSVWLGCVRNNSLYPGTTWASEHYDMITVTDWTVYFFIPTAIRETVPYSAIETAHNTAEWRDTNQSEVFVTLGDYNFSLVITTPGLAADFATDLWDNNDFNIVLSEVIVTDYAAENDWWSFIFQLLFLQLPEVHWFVNALMAIPFWIAIGFVVITFVGRMLPDWISGGA